MSSHREFHYGLRPAKNIERKMLCETIQKLAHFENLNNYQYVGFGSRYFTDFTLIHKTVGIHRMISIEKDRSNKEWFEFNRPYDCIAAIYDHSNSVLPDLDWSIPTILWLDYDGKLETGVFSDISSCCSSAVAGSMLLITVNSDPTIFSNYNKRMIEFNSYVGESRIPSGTQKNTLGKPGLPKVLRKIIDNEIQEKLSIRNNVLPVDEKLIYKQLFNFVYEDGAQMLTVGGVFYKNGQEQLIEKCAFSDFEYIQTGEASYKIKVPNLTIREIHYLNQLLPLSEDPSPSFIPVKEIKQYAKIYRYFPAFTETEL